MASRAVVYFAGVGTVVAALGVGFGGAVFLASTTPLHKEPAAAFSKRGIPLHQTQQAQAARPAEVSPTIASVPPVPKKIEEVAALQFAPPTKQPVTATRPSIATDPTPALLATPKPTAPPSSVAASPSSPPAQAVRAAPKVKEIKPIRNPERRGAVQFADRGRSTVDFDTDDGYGRMSFAQPERRHHRLFGFAD